MKKIILFLLTICIFLSSTIIATAKDTIKVYINGVMLQSSKVPYIDSGRTMVPMRKIFESLDATVDWDGNTQTITATKGNIEIKLQIGNSTLTKNNKEEKLDVAPVIIGDTTYVPARAVAQALGTNVEWLADSSTVNITSPGVKILNKYPNIILPIYEETIIIKDDSEEGCIIRFLNEKNEDFRNDFPIPNDKVRMLNSWIEELEKIGWNNKKIESKWEWDNGIKYDFYENSSSECMYGFNVNLDYIFDPYDMCQYLCIEIEPYNYEIVYNNIGEFKKVREGEKTAYDYALDGWFISWPKKFTIYDSENNSLDVYDYEAIPYLNKGWSKEPNMVTMYSPDWRTVSVGVQEVEKYKSSGWYTEPVTLMYAEDGRTRYTIKSEVEVYKKVGWSTQPYIVTLYDTNGYPSEIPQHEVEKYLRNGWYTEPVTLMYAEDGRTRYTIKSEVEAYKKVGWSTQPYTVTLYDINGYPSEIPQHEVEKYLRNGWYYEPVTKMYAEDGRTMYVADSEVKAYEAVGWYTFPPELNQHLISPDDNSDNNDSYQGSMVYVAASGNGERYHYKSTCIKSSSSMSISDAKSRGYTPCSKCAK